MLALPQSAAATVVILVGGGGAAARIIRAAASEFTVLVPQNTHFTTQSRNDQVVMRAMKTRRDSASVVSR